MLKRIFETGLERLGRIIASQHNISVVFGGSDAYTDGKTIHLPSTGELSAELQHELHGFLDHEVSHCLYTDFDQFKKLLKRGGRFQKELLNAVEDVRVEREIIKEFPGCRMNLDPLNEKLCSKLENSPERPYAKMPWPFRFMYTVSREMEGETYPKPADDIKLFLEMCKDERGKLNDAESTDDLRVLCESMTKKIMKKMDDEKKEEEKKKKEDGKGESEKGEGESKEKSDKASDKKSDEKKSKGKKGDGKSKSKTKGEGEGDSKDSGGRSKKEDKMMTSDKDKAWDDYDMTVDDMVKRDVKEYCKDKPHGEGEKTKAISEASGAFRRTNKKHIPATTQFDKEINLTGKGNHSRYDKLKAEVYPHVATIRRSFEKTLKVQENARWAQERERGMINSRSLNRLVSDPNYRRPFKQLEKTETNNVAIQILIDLSGSMHGSRIEVAKSTAIALAEALKSLSIPFEVTGFHSSYDESLDRHVREKDTGHYNRVYERLNKYIFKSFDSTKLSGLEKIQSGDQNPDGEAVRWAANRLSTQKQKRKILMVLSDGQPATGEGDRNLLNQDLFDTVRKISKAGIEVIGVGIQTRSVQEFYPNNIVIDKLHDLPKKALSKLAKIITKG